MGKTTNILDLNNRLEKVEKGNVAQNNYNSLKNRPKINGNLLTGDKTGTQLGLADAQDIGDISDLTTTDKSSCVGAINEVNGVINALNSRVMTSGNSYVRSVNFPCRSGFGCVSVNAFVQQYGSVIFDVLVSDRNIITKDRITGTSVSSDVATFACNNEVLTVTFRDRTAYTATFQTP